MKRHALSNRLFFFSAIPVKFIQIVLLYCKNYAFLPSPVMSHPSDTSIEDKFLAAYDDYADAIFRHCALRLYDRELGRDLMQETFLRAWQTLAKGTDVTQIRAFLYKIANNLIIDTVRRRKLRTVDSLEDMREEQGFDLPDREPDPARYTEGKFVLGSIDKLEEPYRTAIIMRYVDDLPPKDIADLLGVTPNVVSVRIHRGLDQLSSLLQPTTSSPQSLHE